MSTITDIARHMQRTTNEALEGEAKRRIADGESQTDMTALSVQVCQCRGIMNKTKPKSDVFWASWNADPEDPTKYQFSTWRGDRCPHMSAGVSDEQIPDAEWHMKEDNQ